MGAVEDIKKEIEDALRDAFRAISPQDLDALYKETIGYTVKEWQNFQLAAAAAGGAAGALLPGAPLLASPRTSLICCIEWGAQALELERYLGAVDSTTMCSARRISLRCLRSGRIPRA